MSLTIGTDQAVTLHVSGLNAAGNEVPVLPAKPTWTVDQPTRILLYPDQSGNSCLCVAGATGTAVVTAHDSNDTLTQTFTIIVASTAPTSLVIVNDDPIPKPKQSRP